MHLWCVCICVCVCVCVHTCMCVCVYRHPVLHDTQCYTYSHTLPSLLQIAGPPGCGKTQFCMTLSVLATLPLAAGGCGGNVLYIDTEGAFSAKRFSFSSVFYLAVP